MFGVNVSSVTPSGYPCVMLPVMVPWLRSGPVVIMLLRLSRRGTYHAAPCVISNAGRALLDGCSGFSTVSRLCWPVNDTHQRHCNIIQIANSFACAWTFGVAVCVAFAFWRQRRNMKRSPRIRFRPWRPFFRQDVPKCKRNNPCAH